MSEIDLDRLGDVWRAQPDPAEIERLRRSADVVRRRARFGQIADFWLAVLVSGVVLVLIVSNPRVETGLVGGAAILLMLFSTVRQRRLRMIELATLSGSTEHMLDQSIARARATIRRARLNLLTTPLGLPLGIAFGAALDRGQGSGMYQRLTSEPLITALVAITLLVAAATICVYLVRVQREAHRELERLTQLRQAYEAEGAAE
ncbi:hypothetical protein [Sphingosinicella sp.]|uniref:hypothetical protein n=1 Tax=Sphingosinicella sp. TaxID=1917971 RepID=UPI00403768D2